MPEVCPGLWFIGVMATTTMRISVELNVAEVKDNPLLASDLLPIDSQFVDTKILKKSTRSSRSDEHLALAG